MSCRWNFSFNIIQKLIHSDSFVRSNKHTDQHGPLQWSVICNLYKTLPSCLTPDPSTLSCFAYQESWSKTTTISQSALTLLHYVTLGMYTSFVSTYLQFLQSQLPVLQIYFSSLLYRLYQTVSIQHWFVVDQMSSFAQIILQINSYKILIYQISLFMEI